jgi:hypothetical protein
MLLIPGTSVTRLEEIQAASDIKRDEDDLVTLEDVQMTGAPGH